MKAYWEKIFLAFLEQHQVYHTIMCSDLIFSFVAVASTALSFSVHIYMKNDLKEPDRLIIVNLLPRMLILTYGLPCFPAV